MSLVAGQLVQLTHRLDQHWYLGRAPPQAGLIPAARVEVVAGGWELPALHPTLTARHTAAARPATAGFV